MGGSVLFADPPICLTEVSMNLHEFFTDHPRVAIAFSGGVDSAYLLYAAKQYAKDVCAYYVKSAFQPQFELNDALCKQPLSAASRAAFPGQSGPY